MKVRMQGHAAGPDGHLFPGEVHDLPEDLAAQLVEAREATALETDPDGETASADADGETASLKAKRKRG